MRPRSGVTPTPNRESVHCKQTTTSEAPLARTSRRRRGSPRPTRKPRHRRRRCANKEAKKVCRREGGIRVGRASPPSILPKKNPASPPSCVGKSRSTTNTELPDTNIVLNHAPAVEPATNNRHAMRRLKPKRKRVNNKGQPSLTTNWWRADRPESKTTTARKCIREQGLEYKAEHTEGRTTTDLNATNTHPLNRERGRCTKAKDDNHGRPNTRRWPSDRRRLGVGSRLCAGMVHTPGVGESP